MGLALILIDEAVDRSALTTGRPLFRYDEADEVEVLDDPTWVAAKCGLLEVGLGAPWLVDDREQAILTRGWRARTADS